MNFDLFAILKNIKKNISKTDIFVILVLVGLFFLSRLLNLTQMPIFTDEAIYIHWAKLAWKDASWRFVSLTDGRQPLQTWATIPFLKLFSNPLLAGRLFGVFSGLLALTGIFSLAFYLFGKRGAYLASLIYILNPYYLFYDRMAMVDSAVNGFFIWFVFFGLILLKYPRLDLALIFGLLSGLGTLAKSTVRLFFLPLLFGPLAYYQQKNWLKKTINYLVLIFLAAILALIIYNLQRLSPYMHFIEQKNTTFVKTIPEFFHNPFDPLLYNLKTIPFYFTAESGYLLMILGLLGLIWLWKKQPILVFQLLMFFAVPFVVISAMAKVVFPRYLIFLTIPFLLGLTYLCLHSSKRWFWLAVYFVTAIIMVGKVIFAPQLLPWPEIDRGQYFEGTSAGNGTLEIVKYLKTQELNHQEVYVFTNGTFGLLPYALDIYFPHNQPKVKFEARWPIKNEDLQYAQQLSKKHPVYLVFNETEEFPQEWLTQLRLIKKYPRYRKQNFIYFFQYLPSSTE